ncbi:MAG TPA: AI-2E family transporter [Lautropia sp.]|nr:AI-2E family transporter [Lautropia sp.]
MSRHPGADPPAVEADKALAEHDDPGISPSRVLDDRVRREIERAAIWIAAVGLFVLAVYISYSLLIVFGAMVFAAMIDGGARLLGKVLPVWRGVRVAIVCLVALAFFAWLTYFAGVRLSQEAAVLPELVERQVSTALMWAEAQGFDINQARLQNYASQLMSGVGMLTQAVGGLVGGFTTLILILIIGIYVAAEPRLYERGVAWMFPRGQRGSLYVTLDRMAFTMRRLMAGRLLGMVVEGIFTYILLAWYGVPLAALLAILTGLLAFIPNVGAIISGLLMVLVGFSVSTDMGLYTIFVYFLVQTIDGYVLVPFIARKTVDLAPALVLAAQLVMGVLFGILGLFLADPLLAMIKVMLERRAENVADRLGDGTAAPAAAS